MGLVTALTLALTIEAQNFASARHFAAWLGGDRDGSVGIADGELMPKAHYTGGKNPMGRISKASNHRLRVLRVVGATAVIRCAKPGGLSAADWRLRSLARKPRKLAAFALANKTARIVWSMMARAGLPATAGRRLSRDAALGSRAQQRWRELGPASGAIR